MSAAESCHDGVLEVKVPLPKGSGSKPVVITPKAA
jgi:hypothetical protein